MILVVFLTLFGLFLVKSQDVFENRITLLEPDVYIMLWNTTKTNITIELRVKTVGYIGFGFNKNGEMSGADAVVTWFNGNQINFRDKHIRERLVEDDTSQDVDLLQSGFSDGYTIVRFRRNINTCDTKDDLVLSNDLKIIFSFNQIPFTQSAYHGPNQRGSASISLFNHEIDNNCLNITSIKTNESVRVNLSLCLYFTIAIFLIF